MYTFLIIFIFAVLKSVADIIKVPATFNNSIFIHFSGRAWLDPLTIKPETKWVLLRPFHACFRDLWHTLNTVNICLLLLLPLAYINSFSTWPYWAYFIAWWVVYGVTFEFFYRTWKYLK